MRTEQVIGASSAPRGQVVMMLGRGRDGVKVTHHKARCEFTAGKTHICQKEADEGGQSNVRHQTRGALTSVLLSGMPDGRSGAVHPYNRNRYRRWPLRPILPFT